MIIKTEDQFNEALDRMKEAEYLIVDIETSGFELWAEDRSCGIGICLPDETTYYFPFRHQKNMDGLEILALLEAPNNNLPMALMSILIEAIMNSPKIIGHNIKFDLAGLHQDGYEVLDHQEIEDTIIGSRLYFPGRHPDLSLENTAKEMLGLDQSEYKQKFKDYLKSRNWQHHFDYAPPEIVGEYCESDVLVTGRARKELLKYIEKTNQKFIWDMECKLLKVLWEMEKTGLHYDLEYCLDRIPKLEARISMIEKEIWELCGSEFNIGSGDQITEAFHKLGIKPLAFTNPSSTFPEGKPKWDVSTLMAVDHPAGGLILEHRGLEKLMNTYFTPILKYRDTQIIHTSFKPWGTATGRMSCTNPNLQNISKASQNLLGNDVSEEALDALKAFLGARKGEVVDMSAKEGGLAGGVNLAGMMALTDKFDAGDESVAVRRLYTPRPGYNMWMIDYSQMEMRVFADYVNDEQLTALLEDPNFDFHTHVAKTVWKIDETHSLWDFYRTLAKAVNFGLIYGIGTKKLASQIQKSVEEATQYRIDYFKRFPKAEAFIRTVCNVVESRGYISNRFGRRYYLDADRSYVGVNYLVQGTSADIVKQAMIDIHDFLRKEKVKSRLLVQVHDEVDFEMAEDEEQQLIPEIVKICEKRRIAAYLPTDTSKGFPSWAQKEKMCLKCWNPKIKEKDEAGNDKPHICQK